MRRFRGWFDPPGAERPKQIFGVDLDRMREWANKVVVDQEVTPDNKPTPVFIFEIKEVKVSTIYPKGYDESGAKSTTVDKPVDNK